MPNRVEEQLRAIDNTIAHHKLQIKELNQAKIELMDKYDIPYTKDENITIIERTTAERKAEAEELFEKCRSYLDRGYSLRKAAAIVTDKQNVNVRLAWYKELKEVAKKEGYRVGL